jgi:hypothetical protein
MAQNIRKRLHVLVADHQTAHHPKEGFQKTNSTSKSCVLKGRKEESSDWKMPARSRDGFCVEGNCCSEKTEEVSEHREAIKYLYG